MNLSDAISYLQDTKNSNRILKTEKLALELVLEVLQSNVDVEAWDEEDRLNTPMCQHCSGNGCVSCKGTGEAKIF